MSSRSARPLHPRVLPRAEPPPKETRHAPCPRVPARLRRAAAPHVRPNPPARSPAPSGPRTAPAAAGRPDAGGPRGLAQRRHRPRRPLPGDRARPRRLSARAGRAGLPAQPRAPGHRRRPTRARRADARARAHARARGGRGHARRRPALHPGRQRQRPRPRALAAREASSVLQLLQELPGVAVARSERSARRPPRSCAGASRASRASSSTACP